MTDAENSALEKFIGDVARADKIIDSLNDNDVITIPGHANITGKDLKELWAKTDFVINDDNVAYANNSYRGEAAYQNGNPQISFNIHTLVNYENDVSANGDGGLWVIFHELGHMTPVGFAAAATFDASHSTADQETSERAASDTARTITDHYVGNYVHFDPSANLYSSTQGSIVFDTSSGPASSPNIPH